MQSLEHASIDARLPCPARASPVSALLRGVTMRSAYVAAVVMIGIATATNARTGWRQDGSLLAPFPGGVVAPDGRGGVFCAAGGYPRRFPRLYKLVADGDTASGWVTRGLELTPHAVITEHNSITPVGALPDGLGLRGRGVPR